MAPWRRVIGVRRSGCGGKTTFEKKPLRPRDGLSAMFFSEGIQRMYPRDPVASISAAM